MAHTRLFRFYITVDDTPVQYSIEKDFAPDITGYCLNYDIGELAGPAHTSDDLGGWKRVDNTGIHDLALSTVEKSHFWIGVIVLPNPILDPDAPSRTRDASGKVIVTNHDIIYWSDDLRLSGTKYVP